MQLKNVKQSHNTHMEVQVGERMYRCYSFTTSALDGGEWSASYPGQNAVKTWHKMDLM
jgi:hypothetical protein